MWHTILSSLLEDIIRGITTNSYHKEIKVCRTYQRNMQDKNRVLNGKMESRIKHICTSDVSGVNILCYAATFAKILKCLSECAWFLWQLKHIDWSSKCIHIHIFNITAHWKNGVKGDEPVTSWVWDRAASCLNLSSTLLVYLEFCTLSGWICLN